MNIDQTRLIFAFFLTSLILIGVWIFIKLLERSIVKNPENYFIDDKILIKKTKHKF
jgi:uncharacterized protein YneF (UPF0154 family)